MDGGPPEQPGEPEPIRIELDEIRDALSDEDDAAPPPASDVTWATHPNVPEPPADANGIGKAPSNGNGDDTTAGEGTGTRSISKAAARWKKATAVAQVISKLQEIDTKIKVDGAIAKEDADWEQYYPRIETTKPRYILLPSHPFLRVWEGVLVILLIYVAVILPFRIAMLYPSSGSWLGVDIAVDALFALDMVIIFFTAYEDGRTRQLVVEPRQIALHYLKAWFLVDLLATFPIYAFDSSDESLNKIARFARLPRLIKLVRLFRLAKMARLFRLQEFMRRLQNYLRLSLSFRRLMKFAFWVVIIVHIAGCIYVFIAHYHDFGPDTWTFRYGLGTNASAIELYTSGLYWAVQTLTTVGYGDLSARNTGERVFAIIVMLLGASIFAFCISNMSALVASLDNESMKQKKKLDILTEFLRDANLPDVLSVRLIQHFDKQTDNVSLTYKQREFIWNEMSPSLRVEVAHEMYREFISKVTFFKGKDPQFVADLVRNLSVMKTEASDVILEEGEHAHDMYFIAKGRVEVWHSTQERPLRNLVEGSFFGDEMLVSDEHCFTIKALTPCELYYISRKALFKLLREYPKVAATMKTSAKDRLRRINLRPRVSIVAGELGNSSASLHSAVSVHSMFGAPNEVSTALTTIKSELYALERMVRQQQLNASRLEEKVDSLISSLAASVSSARPQATDPSLPRADSSATSKDGLLVRADSATAGTRTPKTVRMAPPVLDSDFVPRSPSL